jgi:ribosome-binding factor A
MKKRNETAEGRSVRLLRVGEQLRHILSELLMRGEIHDEVLAAHSISVNEVRMSPDLRHATVFVRSLGGADNDAVIEALRRNARLLKTEVARRMTMKYAAELKFLPDDSFAEASRIDALLRSPQVARDLDQ